MSLITETGDSVDSPEGRAQIVRLGRPSVLTFLSQGAAGGALGNYILAYVMGFFFPDFVLVLFLPFYLVWGALIGTATGFVIWLLVRLVKRKFTVLVRLVISSLFTILFFVIIGELLGLDAEIQDSALYRLSAQFAFPVPIGLLVGSRVQLWSVIARGAATLPKLQVLFNREPIRITRTIGALRFSYLMGLPLRAVSLFGLMASLLTTACFLFLFMEDLSDSETRNVIDELGEAFIVCLVVTLYFAMSVYVSFNPGQKWAALGVAVFLHAPLTVWIITIPVSSFFHNFLVVLAAAFSGVWLLFLMGLFLPARKGPLQVEYGHTEIRFGKPLWVKEMS